MSRRICGVTDRPNGSAVRLVYVKCRSADSDSSFLIVPSADTDAYSPTPIEWVLKGEVCGGEVCGLQPRFCCYVFIPPFFYTRAGDVRSLSLSFYLFRVRQLSSAHTAQLEAEMLS